MKYIIQPNHFLKLKLYNQLQTVIFLRPQSVQFQKKSKSTQKNEKIKKVGSRKCYTCKPRGKVLKHIIPGTGSENVIFHFDLHKRPVILVTPNKHYESFQDIPHSQVLELFQSIHNFCEFWKIKDYQISYNNGAWQTHSHFHIKIKANEKIINRMRRDHFRMIALESKYKSTNCDSNSVTAAK